jgi:hypothetical protein
MLVLAPSWLPTAYRSQTSVQHGSQDLQSVISTDHAVVGAFGVWHETNHIPLSIRHPGDVIK